jgi:hypothetical protein
MKFHPSQTIFLIVLTIPPSKKIIVNVAVIYTTIGGAIFLSSFHYYGPLWEMVVQQNPCQKESKTLRE